MATTEVEEPAPNTFTVVERATKVTEQVTGTDEAFSLRMFIALILVTIAVVTTPLPFNVIGAIAMVVLVIEVTRMAWKRARH